MKIKKSADTALELTIQLIDQGKISAEDLDGMTRLLTDEIEEIPGIDRVRLKPSGNRPAAGSKSGAQAVTLGAWVLAVLPEATSSLIGFFEAWTLWPGNPPIKIKAQAADRCIELEFDPRVTNKDEVLALVREMQAMVQAGADH